ncbi:rluC [Blepharisma stoltei]|uniref:Pseudouridine synthase RsuA/RluA-like domain-containing protein n=1 Tax=Blepharisma stoltei TaxID=1481888 RepID=A0AAU9IRF5_9CILI|nr:unnamed protein product [Blepharisma stoltei]
MQSLMIGFKDAGLRLDKFLLKRSKLPWTLVNKLLRTGEVYAMNESGKTSSNLYKLQINDKFYFPKYINFDSPIVANNDMKDMFQKWIIYEDDDIIVINKPAGIATQGGIKIKLSADKLAMNYFEGSRLMHRLDQNVSGIMAFGKSSKACQLDMEEKEYIGIVKGKPLKDKGELSTFLKESEEGWQEVNEVGKFAKTFYEMLTTSKYLGSPFSCLKFKLVTGRKHQIRVHASKVLKCPLVGDYKYGFDCSEFNKEDRIYLHSWGLKIKGKKLEAELPQDFKDMQAKLGLHNLLK